jgi:hypothetical protein
MVGTQNITRNPKESALASLKYRLWYSRVRDEVDMDSWPAPVNATIFNVPMKAGKVMHYIDCRVNSVKPNAASVGDVAPQGELTVVADIEGLSKALLAFLYANNGEDMIIIWEHCATKQKFIAGSPCSGMIMTYTKLGTDDNSTGASIQFKGQCPDPFSFFDGEIPLEAPEVVAVDATTIALGAKAHYKVSENTVATAVTDITGVTDADVNRIIEVIGNGSTNATTIAASSKFILRSGATFVAADGARIAFQIAKVGAGSYAFYEVSRS